MKKTVALIIPLILLILPQAACCARDWFVRPASGAISGKVDGTSFQNAWNALQSINWGKIKPGDTVYIAGSFHEKLAVGKSGTASGLITIRGDLPGNPGAIDVSAGDAVGINNLSNVALEGITIERSGANGISMQGTKNCRVRNCNFYRIGQAGGTVFGIDGRYAQGIRIYNCRMTNEKGAFRGSGIVTGQGLQGSLLPSRIEKCLIKGIETDGIVAGNDTVVSGCEIGGLTDLRTHADGIAVQGSRVTVTRNIIYSCTQAVYSNSFDYGPNAASICDDVTICNNLIYQTRDIPHMNAINCDIETGGQASIRRLKIYNNTIAGVDQYGINVQDRGHGAERFQGLEIMNNIVVDCGSYSSKGSISVSVKGPADPKIDYNLIVSHRQKKPGYNFQGAARSQAQMKALGFEAHGRENYPVDRIFMKYDYQAPDNDLRLKPGSPAIGMALNLGSRCNYDLNGAPRPAAGPWDAGCLSF